MPMPKTSFSLCHCARLCLSLRIILSFGLDYVEDSSSDTDMNVVMTASGRFIELQGTAEGAPFSRTELAGMLDLADKGCREIMLAQRQALGLE